MKKVLLALAGVAMLFAMSSCSEQQYYSMYNHADGRYVNAAVGRMAVKNVEADLKIENTRITYQERFDNDLEERDVNNPEKSRLINYMKDLTVYKAIARYEADLLVGTTFNITTSVDGKYVIVEVRGYPASYTNLRQATCAKCQAGQGAPTCCPEGNTMEVKAPCCDEHAPEMGPAPEQKPAKAKKGAAKRSLR